jgi:nucleolar protein 53
VVTSSAPAKKQKLNAADKERLLRIARKKVVGSDGFGAGSAVISAGPAARGENLRDVWSEVDFVPEPAEGEWGREGRPAPKPKAPKALARQRQLLLKHTEKALPVPHEGMSYNPKLESHQELLDNAVREELARLKKEEEEAKMVQAVSGFILQPQFVPGVAPGMKVADGDETAMENEDEDGDVENSVAVVTKGQKRKTQRDRNKAQRAREAVSSYTTAMAKPQVVLTTVFFGTP